MEIIERAEQLRAAEDEKEQPRQVAAALLLGPLHGAAQADAEHQRRHQGAQGENDHALVGDGPALGGKAVFGEGEAQNAPLPAGREKGKELVVHLADPQVARGLAGSAGGGHLLRRGQVTARVVGGEHRAVTTVQADVVETAPRLHALAKQGLDADELLEALAKAQGALELGGDIGPHRVMGREHRGHLLLLKGQQAQAAVHQLRAYEQEQNRPQDRHRRQSALHRHLHGREGIPRTLRGGGADTRMILTIS